MPSHPSNSTLSGGALAAANEARSDRLGGVGTMSGNMMMTGVTKSMIGTVPNIE